eukprot:5291552-Amphidinium_carterae.1
MAWFADSRHCGMPVQLSLAASFGFTTPDLWHPLVLTDGRFAYALGGACVHHDAMARLGRSRFE